MGDHPCFCAHCNILGIPVVLPQNLQRNQETGSSRSVEYIESCYNQLFIVRNIVYMYVCSLPPARSPLYSHISATLQGLSTIRAFQNEAFAAGRFHRYQNEHTQGWWLYIVSTRWFGMRIDALGAAFLAVVAFISVPLASGDNLYGLHLNVQYIHTDRTSSQISLALP